MDLLYIDEDNSCENYSSNQVSGFKHLLLKKGEVIPSVEKSHNYLFFVRKGEIEILCDEYCRKLKADEFILVPKASESAVRSLSSADVVVHSFDSLFSVCDQFVIEKLEMYTSKVTYAFEPTRVLEPMDRFLDLLTFYIEDKILCKHIQELKQTEMFMLIRTFYSKEECAALFYPILSSNMDFKNMVLDNYQKVRTVQELANICCLSLTTFNRKFRLYFKDSPYNWMLKQKAKHIHVRLRNPNIPICDIIEEFGFSSSGHFTTYCKTYFNMPPTQLRKKLTAESMR